MDTSINEFFSSAEERERMLDAAEAIVLKGLEDESDALAETRWR